MYKESPFKYLDYVSGLGQSNLTFQATIAEACKKMQKSRMISNDIISELLESFPKHLFNHK